MTVRRRLRNTGFVRGVAIISAAVIALGACSFSAELPPPTGNPQIDASISIDGPADDVDGDGVKNTVDNCPSVANAMQFNEDTDATGDECDPCPQLADPADDMDTDGDKVGNGCDPRPTMAGDKLAYWNGFHVPSTALPDRLVMIHGSAARWAVSGGTLIHTRVDEDWGVPAVDVMAPHHTTDTTFQITAAVNNVSTAAAAGAVVDIAADDSLYYDCQARTDFQRREMWLRDPVNGTAGWTALEGTNATTPNDIYRITIHRTATDLPCRTTRLNQTSIDLSNSADAAGNTRAGLFARNVDVRFRYIAVYTSP